MKNKPDDLFPKIAGQTTDDMVQTWAEFLTLPNLPFPNYRLYRGDLIDTAKLDFSIGSLAHVNSYLDFLQLNPPPDSERTKIICRCGGYLGEVVRKASPPNSCHWLTYNEAVERDLVRENYPLGPDNFVSMFNNSLRVSSYPCGKVYRRMYLGEMDSIEDFANLAITVHNQTKEKKDAFFAEVAARAKVTGEKVVPVWVATVKLGGGGPDSRV